MKIATKKLLALAALVSIAACSGGNGSNGPGPLPSASPGSLLSQIVGVGDSLTAGEQSAGLFGGPVGSVPNPLAAGTPASALGVPPTQENGYYSQFYMAATGATYTQMSTPGLSPLPLIAGPGLGNQIVPANPAVTGGLPFGQIPTRSSCDAFNQAAYSPTLALSTVREAPAGSTRDVAVPGITLHEAIALQNPPSPTCAPIPGAPPTVAGLQSLLSESGMYYPILGNFNAQPRRMLNAAMSLRPSLALVWLGANDVLHYAFSAGTFTGVDGINGNTAQVQTDMTTVITSLQKGGAKVIVANLPNVLQEPFYMSVAPVTPGAPQCRVQTYLACVIASIPALAPSAAAITAQVAAAYGLTPSAAGSNPQINGGYGYVTVGGAIAILKAAAAGQAAQLDPSGAGSGNGSNYATPGLAAKIQTLNDTINSGIAAAATAAQVPMVDIHTFNNDVATGCAGGCASDPLAGLALTISPTCCSLAFGGGLQSFDGLHPSNTGYAFIAEAFIQAANRAYAAGIPDINPANVYTGTLAANGTGIPYHDPYAQ